MNEKPTPSWQRRSFLGGLLVSAGAGAGWLVRRFQGPIPRQPTTGSAPGDRFEYSVDEFEHVDPSLLLYRPSDEFPTGLAQVKRLSLWPGNGIVVAGDNLLTVFDDSGAVSHQWTLDRPAHCLLPLDGGELLVGFANQFAVLTSSGVESLRSPTFGRRTYLTSLAAGDETVFAADAGNRRVIRCERATGRVIGQFGGKEPATGNPGFNVPSPYFPLSLSADDNLRVVNPGRLRVETYSLDGEFISAWGEPGMQIERFCGCCNPVYIGTTPTGDIITSEKGLARIKIYGAGGSFKGVVAGPSQLVTDKVLAKKACVDCSIGAAFDIAVTAEGDVLALDPFRKTVRRFKRKEGALS